jgi:hypothetical protein
VSFNKESAGRPRNRPSWAHAAPKRRIPSREELGHVPWSDSDSKISPDRLHLSDFYRVKQWRVLQADWRDPLVLSCAADI